MSTIRQRLGNVIAWVGFVAFTCGKRRKVDAMLQQYGGLALNPAELCQPSSPCPSGLDAI